MDRYLAADEYLAFISSSDRVLEADRNSSHQHKSIKSRSRIRKIITENELSIVPSNRRCLLNLEYDKSVTSSNQKKKTKI
jgi:hypothetical protein